MRDGYLCTIKCLRKTAVEHWSAVWSSSLVLPMREASGSNLGVENDCHICEELSSFSSVPTDIPGH
jgi:hypothetical protein